MMHTLFGRKLKREILYAELLPTSCSHLSIIISSFWWRDPFWRLMPKGEKYWGECKGREIDMRMERGKGEAYIEGFKKSVQG